MFPLKDNIPARHFPAVNLWLIFLNVIFFLYETRLGPGLDGFILDHGFIPARFSAAQTLNFLDLSRFVPVYTSMFLHGSFLHVGGNMWMLWIFGDNVEDRMGHIRYLLFYLLCGTVAALAQFLSQPQSSAPMIGASGAISGVLGAYFLLYPRARILTLVPIFIFFYLLELPAFIFLGLWFFLQFLQGYMHLFSMGSVARGGIAWWAHIGGFAAGAAMVWFFIRKQRS